MNTQDGAEPVLAAVNTLRAPVMSEEYDLHRMLSEAFERAGLSFEHEAVLAPRCRIDFLVGDTGVEVKKGKPDARRLLRQMTRYLSSDRLARAVVVVQQNVSLPETILGKNVAVVSLNRLWGVALP